MSGLRHFLQTFLQQPIVSFLLRLAVSVGAIWVAFSHVAFSDVWPLLQQMKMEWLVLALLALHSDQWFSALRTRFYLSRRDICLTRPSALHLHYVGGLFNALLPGSTGGDVYKAWWLTRHAKRTLSNMFLLMIAGRLNGLWVLGVIACVMALMSEAIRAVSPYAPILIVLLLLLGTFGYHVIARVLLKESLEHQYTAMARYSLPLQLLLALSAWCLLRAMGVEQFWLEYLVLFQLSCVLAMVPISIGGMGVRELALLKGSLLLGLSVEQGVALGLAFSLLTLSISLIGAVLYFRFRPTSS